jgi:hypothetical protein
MKTMKYIAVLFLLFLGGCQRKMANIGYFRNNDYRIEIRSDKTFVYEKIKSHFYAHNIGEWNLNSKKLNRLNLNSTPKNIEPLVTIDSKDVGLINATPIINTKLILKNTAKPLNKFGFWIFSDNRCLSYGNCDSIPSIKNENIKSLTYYFSYVSQKSTLGHSGQLAKITKIEKGYEYDISIELDHSLFFLEAFNNVNVKIKSKKLVIHNFDKQKRIIIPRFYGDTTNFFMHYRVNSKIMNYDF